MERLKNLEELAELLGVEVRTLYVWIVEDRYHIKTKHLIKMGQQWRVNEAGFNDLVEEIKKQSKDGDK